MLNYAVRRAQSGWFIDNTAICYGPYSREDKALAAAESLNRQARERAGRLYVRGEHGGAVEVARA